MYVRLQQLRMKLKRQIGMHGSIVIVLMYVRAACVCMRAQMPAGSVQVSNMVQCSIRVHARIGRHKQVMTCRKEVDSSTHGVIDGV